eukprot:3337919-Alexandrium_andersonii.AAC.1
MTAAAQSGYTALVLGAFGCGAFGHPPAEVARLFRCALADWGGEGRVREVVFCVIDDHNSRRAHNPRGNFAPFRE